MSSCCLQPSNVTVKEKKPGEVEVLMYGFSTLKARLGFKEGHICPYCNTTGDCGSYCITCQRLIPFSAPTKLLPRTSNEFGLYLNTSFVKRQRGPAAMSKKYETKVQNGLLIMTRRRSSRSEPSSEPDRKKIRTSSSKLTSRDRIINRFCDSTSVKPSIPKSSKNKDGNVQGSTKRSAVRDTSATTTTNRDSLPKKSDRIDEEVVKNRINLPVSKAARNRSESVKTAVVAPYFGEKPTTTIFVSSDPVQRNSDETVRHRTSEALQRVQAQRTPSVQESVFPVHAQGNTGGRQPQGRSQPPQIVLSTSTQSQSNYQTPVQSQVQQTTQNLQSNNQSRQQMQIQLVVSNQQQTQDHSPTSTSNPNPVSHSNDLTINTSVQPTSGTQIQRAIVPERLQQQIQQLQFRRNGRQPTRRQTLQITRPATSTVVASQSLVGQLVYVHQAVSDGGNGSMPEVSAIIRNTPINQVGQPTMRSVTVSSKNNNTSISTTSTVTTEVQTTTSESPGPESDELVIIGQSGVTNSPLVTRTTTVTEPTITTRSTSEQGQTSKYIEKFVYAPNGHDGITITNEDVLLLNAECYLNDVLIDFYLKYVFHAQLTPVQQNATYIFNSFFYTRLTQRMPAQGDFTQGHASVAKWTRRVDLFTKDFVLIPINENSHWFLAIICFPWLVGTINYAGLLGGGRDTRITGSGTLDLSVLNDAQRAHYRQLQTEGIEAMPCILMFDSLIGQSRSPNVKILRDYLQCEWNLKSASELGNRFFNKDTIRGFSPKVPQQPNGYDCGVFVLNYAELFYRRPVRSFTKAYFQNEMDGWFAFGEVRQKRLDIRNLIIDLWRGCQTESHSTS